MQQYTTWSRQNFKDVIRREIMDTNTRWLSDSEANFLLDNWVDDLQRSYEFSWAINTITISTATITYTTTGLNTFTIPLSTFNPGMLRLDAIYYNGFRLSGRLLTDLEVGNPVWRSAPVIDVPRLAVQYDATQLLLWPAPSSNCTITFEYPQALQFTPNGAGTETGTSGLPVWTQWSAKSFVAWKFYSRPGPVADLRKALRYKAMYTRAKQRIKLLWDAFQPERYLKLKPAQHYEWNIIIPPPAWDIGTNTATGT